MARSCIGRQDIHGQFHACRHKEDEPLKAYFTKLSNYRIPLDHTGNPITDRDCCSQIFTSLPSKYGMILMVLKNRRPLPTPEEVMHDLSEEQTTASGIKELGEASTGAAHLSQHGGYHGCGRGGCGGRGGHGGSGGIWDSHESKCTYYIIESHSSDAYRRRKHAQEGGKNGND